MFANVFRPFDLTANIDIRNQLYIILQSDQTFEFC